ncbi:tripartite tricarboxylate transporter TctB family protein [Crossiella sp. CA-258035]|uniref:tripartite tricarboxylate transporter TctB family protein n=1 Tax=Crossiella sp. CA-258035 TaxID=2981138 RepID=UPI0024BD10F2|nr:tripartite tricarboxylate transporter TctB family protein [Crossiella sp. CA-258035]WHT19236.1 tripartite tricarboxylate transporter TctB family protein [Crossiella sp. CA-258035]
MSEQTKARPALVWLKERSELGICLLLLALGVLVVADAIRIPANFTQRGPVGPELVPYLVGGGLILVAALLARDVLRGGRGEAEAGEDVDLDAPADWRVVAQLAAAFLANVVLINLVGFPLSGMVLFWGAAYALGSRNFVRDPLVAAGLSILTYLVFNTLLGVSLPGGPLTGVL